MRTVSQRGGKATPLNLGQLQGRDSSEVPWQPTCPVLGEWAPRAWIGAADTAAFTREVFQRWRGGAALGGMQTQLPKRTDKCSPPLPGLKEQWQWQDLLRTGGTARLGGNAIGEEWGKMGRKGDCQGIKIPTSQAKQSGFYLKNKSKMNEEFSVLSQSICWFMLIKLEKLIKYKGKNKYDL